MSVHQASADAGRREIRDELLADLEGVTACIVKAVTAEIPAYTVLAPAQLAEVGAIAAWGTARVLDAWVEGTGLDEADLQRFRGIGAARALDGRPLPVVLRAYRVAGSSVTDLVAARALDRLSVADALALARLWMASIDALSEALYAGHAAATVRISDDRELALGDLLADLVAGRHATRSAIADRSRQLGVRLPEHPLVLVATGGSLAEAGETAWASCLAQACTPQGSAAPAPPSGPDRLTRVQDGLGLAVLPQVPRAVLAAALRARGWSAVALGGHGIDDLPRAFRLAEHALTHAPARAFEARDLLDDADAAALAFASGHRDADATRLHRLVLGPLSRHPVLLHSLDVYLATGSASDAATSAGCHPQTMRQRLRRIGELTGRDPRRGWDRFVLELARLSQRD
ncbi:PucR family transcriptional regulator [Nocardioides sp. 616]|uniref:PucR family transcriptional regulator n=1 Tax=Nocardioides sp. 616 TaxID=2268090 RepID=UPI000CE4D9F4|nr:PucR family transcriptional regulator [Nocardioides sp. 616]